MRASRPRVRWESPDGLVHWSVGFNPIAYQRWAICEDAQVDKYYVYQNHEMEPSSAPVTCVVCVSLINEYDEKEPDETEPEEP